MGDRAVTGVPAEPQPRGGLGEHRNAVLGGEGGEGGGYSRAGFAAGDRQRATGARDRIGEGANQLGLGGAGGKADRQRSLPFAALTRERVSGGDISRPRLGPERIAPGQVQVHRPAPAERLRDCPAGDRAVVQQAIVVRIVAADFAEPAHGGAVEADLVDRLPRADAAQLRRPIGSEGDQRHARQVGLGDRRVQVGSGGAARAGERHGRTGGKRGAEPDEPGRALVEDDLDLDPGLTVERQRHGRRT